MMCEMFSHIMLVFSRITITTLLIAFAFGWQVIYENTIEIKGHIQKIYIFVLVLSAYDDYSLSKWVEEHPADLFHLMQSEIQWTFYATKMVEFFVFAFGVWRSKRVCQKKLDEQQEKLEEDAAVDQQQVAL
mmetsp:Transcript_13184/g.20536  ORF Transcript_13184/g.20536 Transcript_13184/m.20536 type:complete len:131 (+) Transcript_13184:1325-1717(+)